jgi:hypothetical protein
VLELDKVGFGVTGPRDRREAAKWGSRASRSIAREEKRWLAGGCVAILPCWRRGGTLGR